VRSAHRRQPSQSRPCLDRSNASRRRALICSARSRILRRAGRRPRTVWVKVFRRKLRLTDLRVKYVLGIGTFMTRCPCLAQFVGIFARPAQCIALAAIYINNLILIYELHKLSERQFENETSQGRKIVNHHEAAVPPTPASDKEIPPRPSRRRGRSSGAYSRPHLS
jgi:hypothetical protein